ncbi:MAG TPA: HAMP domain-containing sensor histidine kinase, partial [Ramlibacter sp.]
GSVSAMFLIYYHVTDWRLATVGSASGLAVAWLAFRAFGPETAALSLDQQATNAVVIGFAWFMGVVLGISSSNLRREQLNHTLATMGIMAHELRTPLATMSLIGDAVRNEAAGCEPAKGEALEELAERLLGTVRHMNHQIDSEIANARLMRLPGQTETVDAAELVNEAVSGYPYRTERERDCVMVRVDGNFRFLGSQPLFIQVLSNLIKNALRSLAASQHGRSKGDLLILVDGNVERQRGRILVRDRGVGMEPGLQSRIFQPFFSTARGSGHGLGLAFCQRVVHSARGTIRVESEPMRGATFTIELPMADVEQPQAAQTVTPTP